MMFDAAFSLLAAAWTGHTEESRAFAQDIVWALRDICMSQKEASIDMGLTHEQQLSRQLAGTEPLNAFRLSLLPSAFQVAFLKRRAMRLGAALIAPEDLALIRGAALLGPERIAALVPERPWKTRTVTLPFSGQKAQEA